MKIIVTARDAGSAHQNLAFIENCMRYDLALDFRFYVEGPAVEVVESSQFPIAFINICDPSSPSSADRLHYEIEEFRANFALLGLSWDRTGVDELAMGICRKLSVPIAVIQDYWGYVGQFSGDFVPDYFFVCHTEATRLTHNNAQRNIPCIVTGSPKHERYQHYLKDWQNAKIHNGDDEVFQIVFMGQPSIVQGIVENFELFIKAAIKIREPVRVLFKPHPADAENLSIYESILVQSGISFAVASPSDQSEPLLLSADLVVTCFSTAGLDHSYLQFYSGERIGHLIYLAMGDDIKKTLVTAVGESSVPFANVGMGTFCESFDALEIALLKWMRTPDSEYMLKVKEHLNVDDAPTRKIYGFISNLYNNN